MAHAAETLNYIKEFDSLSPHIRLDGNNLTVPRLFSLAKQPGKSEVLLDDKAMKNVEQNFAYLEEKVKDGVVIYGVNTGFGGSADVRSPDVVEVQNGLIRHLNAGFGDIFPPCLPRGVMAVRANSLIRAKSGVRPEVIKLLVDMLNKDIIPQVPKRGSISASGDLMPTSYIAAAMKGRPECKVWYKGQEMTADKALHEAGLSPVTFQSKEALAVVNAASFASTMASLVTYEANVAYLLTQLATAMSVEALRGRIESFHPIIHHSMPHPGQIEVAQNICNLLQGSQLAIMELDIHRPDYDGVLKQDRYALRTAAQWLGPVAETLMKTLGRILVDINSSNDNPIIDHINDCVLHGGNFQGTAMTVAMDQTRQGLQLCGKLMFAQMSEIVNVTLNNGLPPNLAGSDFTTDSGFKGLDVSMAAYQAELDWLTNPLTNHVLAAELHNQAVNSLALISARKSQQALEILQMMLTNILLSQAQAIDLRYLQTQVETQLGILLDECHLSKKEIQPKLQPWYEFAFTPEKAARKLVEKMEKGMDVATFLSKAISKMTAIMNEMKKGTHVSYVTKMLGQGTSVLYSFIRKDLNIKFYDGQNAPDTDLQRILNAIQDHTIDKVIYRIYSRQVRMPQYIPTIQSRI